MCERWLRRSAAWLVALVALTPSVDVALGEELACTSERTKIVGGDNALLKNWPGQAALRLHSREGHVSFYFCGGTAISDRWVLTAAHCVPSFLKKRTGPLTGSDGNSYSGQLEVVLGIDQLADATDADAYPVEQVIVHERYRAEIEKALKLEAQSQRTSALASIAERNGDDIALLKLGRSWRGPVASLALASADIAPGRPVRVAGFGKTDPAKRTLQRFAAPKSKGEFMAGSPHLLETAVETIAESQCKGRYPVAQIGPGQVCAGLEQGGQDSCQGDSGGPLVTAAANGCPVQIGVVSWGAGCAEKQGYGVYTSVAHYSDWIQRHTGPLKGAAIDLRREVSTLSVAELDEALAQLSTLLGGTRGRVAIGVQGGNRVRLGGLVVFEATSSIAGRLVILDINAAREVTLIYPNKYVANDSLGAIAPGGRAVVPGPDYPGFTSFEAVKPTGRGQLLALVVPPDFAIERYIVEPAILTKGFVPRNDPPSYLMRLIRQIETSIGASAKAGGAESGAAAWGYAVTDYDIVE